MAWSRVAGDSVKAYLRGCVGHGMGRALAQASSMFLELQVVSPTTSAAATFFAASSAVRFGTHFMLPPVARAMR